MSVVHISFLFSEMLGVRNKLCDMELASVSAFPELKFRVFDFSKRIRFLRLVFGFNKGFFIPLADEVVIIRHNFFDLSMFIVFLLRKLLRKSNFIEHHSDHIVELKRRGFWGHLLAAHEAIMCKLVGPLIDGHLSVSESVETSQSKYFRRMTSIIMENGYRLRQDNQASRVKSRTKHSLVFCAAKFSDWHGLDLLISIAGKDPIFREKFIVYLIGDVGDYHMPANFVECGVLQPHEIDGLIRECDMCVDSLGLARLGLTSSSSLKGKQYVANGKPILGCCSVHERYDAFTYILDRQEQIGNELIDFLSSFDRRRLEQVSKDLYEQQISWESVLKRLKLNLIEEGVL